MGSQWTPGNVEDIGVDMLTALIAGLLSVLRTAVGSDVCPGGWAWATSALGVGVGLLPTTGALGVAVLRLRIGSRYGVAESTLLIGSGLLAAGLLPLLAFVATGRVFATSAAGGIVPGLGAQGDLAAACFVGPQDEYLGVGTVAAAFGGDNPVRFAVALLALGLLPLLTAAFVAAQARLALRRGPGWPSRFFWLPVLGIALLTGSTPAGSSAHLWLGVTAGAFLGILVMTVVPPPSRETVRRSMVTAPRQDGPAPSATRRAPAAATGRARFRLVRRLGAGGFGRVWLAHDSRLGHTVAVKAAHAPDAETEERIRREARALGAVRHPHCVRIHDLVHAGSDPGLSELDGMVIVMEYLQGCSLGELVRTQGVLDDLAAARVWSSIAGALDAAHGCGVLHRDVKPGNVVVDPAGLAHLIDFGITRQTGDATLTMAGFVLGTPDFLAPEVAAGGAATPTSDAWQLAATVSFALTGHPPRGEHPDAVSGLRAAAAGAALTHLPTRTGHLALLGAALDTDPARRPPLVAVQRALDGWLLRAGARPDEPVTAGPAGR